MYMLMIIVFQSIIDHQFLYAAYKQRNSNVSIKLIYIHILYYYMPCLHLQHFHINTV